MKRQAGLHDSFFKSTFKNHKYIRKLLQIIFPAEVLIHTSLDKVTVQDGELSTLGGGQLRADLVVALPLKDDTSTAEITVSLIFEHKSYRDPDAIIQIMEYYVELCREQRKQKQGKRNIIIPVVLLCCKDKDYHPPSDYLQWVFGDEEVPEAARALAPWLPKLFGNVVNLRQLPPERVWTVGDSIGIIVHGMCELWDANDDTLALMFEKARQLARTEAVNLLAALRDYYHSADNSIDRQDFARVERERWPDLKEEDRFMPTIDFGFERAERQGREQGIEQERLDTANRMLTRGMPEDQILDVLQLNVEQLEKIKRQIKS